MNFLLILLLVLTSILYIKIAVRFGIIDKPNIRSSHTDPTIRGGGIIFPVAIILFFLSSSWKYPYFFTGLMLVAIISFLDDIYTLSGNLRLPVQLLGIILVFIESGIFEFPLLMVLGFLILATGFLNIYNFMDGINGITGLYSIVIVLALLYTNTFVVEFIDQNLLILTLASLLIFGYYNFRKKAKCFAGDIGSISIGIILIFCICKLTVSTNNIFYVFFLLVYMIDGGFTLVERIFRKENIFKAHRNHLYQLMIDKGGYGHLEVAGTYGFVQLLVCAITIYSLHYLQNEIYLILLAIILGIIYTIDHV